jgi:hypothetical protein
MGTNKTIEKPTIIATNTPRVELANTYPTVSSPADMGGINVSMIHCIIFSNIIENDALAKLLVIAAMRVRPGIRKCKNGMSAAERPSPSKAKLNTERNRRVVTTGATNVCIYIFEKRLISRLYKDHAPIIFK